MKKRTVKLVTTLSAVVVAVAAAAGAVLATNHSTNAASNSGTVKPCSIVGQNNVLNCRDAPNAEDELLTLASKERHPAPTGPGPWHFVAVRTLNKGVKARSTPVQQAVQLGGLAPAHDAWVVCQARSGFDPEPQTGNGDRWYKIKWGQTQHSTDYFESEVGAPDTAWVYGYYLTPWDTNGDVPACSP